MSIESTDGQAVTSDDSTAVTLGLRDSNDGAVLTCSSLDGSGSVTVASGTATFECALNKAGRNYTLTATDGEVPAVSAYSNSFNITPAAATQLVFTDAADQHHGRLGDHAAVEVSVEDSYGNLEAGDNTTTVTVALGSNPGSGTLTGTLTQTVIAGVASLNNLSTSAANGYTLTAASNPSHGSSTSSSLNISAAAATQLVFTTQPISTTAGSAITPAVEVSVEDSYGNLEAGDNTTTVTVALGSNPGSGTLTGTLTQTVIAGVASFTTSAANGYTLTAASNPSHGSSTSLSFNISAAAATQLLFTTQPISTTAGSAITPAVEVSVQTATAELEAGDNQPRSRSRSAATPAATNSPASHPNGHSRRRQL